VQYQFMTALLRLTRVLSVALLGATVSCVQDPGEASDSAQMEAVDSLARIVDTDETLYPDPIDLTRFRMRQLQRLVTRYHAATGTAPDSLGDVLSPSLAPEYRSAALRDAWGSEFRLTQSGRRLELLSAGADHTLGTADDLLVTWEP